jgi:hypothetical protein
MSIHPSKAFAPIAHTTLSHPAEGIAIMNADAPSAASSDRFYTVPIPIVNILEILGMIAPELMREFAAHNMKVLQDGAYHQVRLPSYASVVQALIRH